MANRYTDTAIWNKQWFRELSPKMKAVWKYLTDNCDHAGLWDIDQGKLNYNLNEVVTIDEIFSIDAFKSRFQIIEDKIFIAGYVSYQYKNNLNPDNRVHQSVIARLEKFCIDIKQFQTKQAPKQGAKDKELELVKELENCIRANFPKKDSDYTLGINEVVKKLSKDEIEQVKQSIVNYAQKTKDDKTEVRFTKTFNTFISEGVWLEVLNYKSPESKIHSNAVKNEFLADQEAAAANITPEGAANALNGPAAKEFKEKLGMLKAVPK